jgi:protein-tyrosine-phosphatase
VLVVCSHNRTRSVMAAGLLRHALMARTDAVVESAGFGEPGLPADPNATRLLSTMGIDVRDHLSRRVTVDMVSNANLVLCAERQHVFSVVADLGGRFERSFTLPEFAAGAGLTRERSHSVDYIYSAVPEVPDPTGRTWAAWERVWRQLEYECALAADRIVASRTR